MSKSIISSWIFTFSPTITYTSKLDSLSFTTMSSFQQIIGPIMVVEDILYLDIWDHSKSSSFVTWFVYHITYIPLCFHCMQGGDIACLNYYLIFFLFFLWDLSMYFISNLFKNGHPKTIGFYHFILLELCPQLQLWVICI